MIVPVIPPEKLEELQEVILELEDEVSDVWNSFLDGMAEFWRIILAVSGVLFMLLVLGLLSYFMISWLLADSIRIDLEEKETHITTRHLLDLSEAERWRFLEDVDAKMMPTSVLSVLMMIASAMKSMSRT